MGWLVSVGAVTVVVLLYWTLLDWVLDHFGPPPPSATRAGGAA